MRSFLPVLILLLSTLLLKAQNYEATKNLIAMSQYTQAKEAIDRAMSNAAFISKAEAFIQKAAIYAGLAADPSRQGTTAADQLLAEADRAFKKYQEMDPEESLLSDVIYKPTPINIYAGFFASGYRDYEIKNWKPGFEKFKKVIEYSDMLAAKRIIGTDLDTNSILLAGITAEGAGLRDEAVKYYERLADLMISNPEYEGLYHFMVSYYAARNDLDKFEKYRIIGRKLYPNSQYFSYDKVDFAIGREPDLNKKIKALESILAADPSNEKANSILAGIIYDALNPVNPGPLPANAAELEAKMIALFKNEALLKPGDEAPWVSIGDHFIYKSIRLDAARQKAANAKSKTDELDRQYDSAYNAAREPYAKAAEIIAAKTELTPAQKQNYKKISGYLADIANYNKDKFKRNSAEWINYEAEEKKWNDAYQSVR